MLSIIGYITDGPTMFQDADYQHERTTVTIWFDNFEVKF